MMETVGIEPTQCSRREPRGAFIFTVQTIRPHAKAAIASS